MWFPSLVQLLYLFFLSSQVYALFQHFPTPSTGLVDSSKLLRLKLLTSAATLVSAPSIFSTSLPTAYSHSGHAATLHLISWLCLAGSLGLFAWCAETTGEGKLSVIFGRVTPKYVIESGPYALVRHPVYVSYALGWTGATLASMQEWTHNGGFVGLVRVLAMMGCLVGLCGLYKDGADVEEKQFLLNKEIVSGDTVDVGVKRKYESYKSVVGARWIPGVI